MGIFCYTGKTDPVAIFKYVALLVILPFIRFIAELLQTRSKTYSMNLNLNNNRKNSVQRGCIIAYFM